MFLTLWLVHLFSNCGLYFVTVQKNNLCFAKQIHMLFYSGSMDLCYACLGCKLTENVGRFYNQVPFALGSHFNFQLFCKSRTFLTLKQIRKIHWLLPEIRIIVESYQYTQIHTHTNLNIIKNNSQVSFLILNFIVDMPSLLSNLSNWSYIT